MIAFFEIHLTLFFLAKIAYIVISLDVVFGLFMSSHFAKKKNKLNATKMCFSFFWICFDFDWSW